MINKKIKIVKRIDAVPTMRGKARKAKPRNAAREMAAAVTGWVADLKERKGGETKAAFDALFAAAPQASES